MPAGNAANTLGTKAQQAAVGHRVARVDGDVEQRRLELTRIRQHRRALRRDGNVDRDPLIERAPKHVGERMKQATDVEGAWLQYLAARERQQLVGELGTAARGPARRAHQLLSVRLARERRKLLENLQVSLDDGQQVVEIVGDAAGQLADAFESLRVAQGLLRLRPLQAAGEEVAERLEKAHFVVAEVAMLARAYREHADGPAAIRQRHGKRADQTLVQIGLRHREAGLAAVVGDS